LVSIIGVLATVGPCLTVLCGPLLLRCAKWLHENVLRPLALRLHRWGLFEVVAYALAATFTAQGLRYPAGQADAGTMVALTGGLAFAPCWAYSTALHTSGSGDKDKFLTLSYVLAALVFAPLAVTHDSRLAGFLAVLALYGALGFVLFAFGFGFVIGFDSKNAMLRSACTSLVLVAGFSLARLAGLDPAYLRPFATAAMILGNVVYFLALLIYSSRFGTCEASYAHRQCLMLVSLIIALLAGNVYSMASMTNTATTFLVLWLMEKELEVSWGPGPGMIVLFLNFVFLYFLAHYLHTHPEHVVSL